MHSPVDRSPRHDGRTSETMRMPSGENLSNETMWQPSLAVNLPVIASRRCTPSQVSYTKCLLSGENFAEVERQLKVEMLLPVWVSHIRIFFIALETYLEPSGQTATQHIRSEEFPWLTMLCACPDDFWSRRMLLKKAERCGRKVLEIPLLT